MQQVGYQHPAQKCKSSQYSPFDAALKSRYQNCASFPSTSTPLHSRCSILYFLFTREPLITNDKDKSTSMSSIDCRKTISVSWFLLQGSLFLAGRSVTISPVLVVRSLPLLRQAPRPFCPNLTCFSQPVVSDIHSVPRSRVRKSCVGRRRRLNRGACYVINTPNLWFSS
jgi:hypothetical protein